MHIDIIEKAKELKMKPIEVFIISYNGYTYTIPTDTSISPIKSDVYEKYTPCKDHELNIKWGADNDK